MTPDLLFLETELDSVVDSRKEIISFKSKRNTESIDASHSLRKNPKALAPRSLRKLTKKGFRNSFWNSATVSPSALAFISCSLVDMST